MCNGILRASCQKIAFIKMIKLVFKHFDSINFFEAVLSEKSFLSGPLKKKNYFLSQKKVPKKRMTTKLEGQGG